MKTSNLTGESIIIYATNEKERALAVLTPIQIEGVRHFFD
jgi:hypothetical protein